MRLILNDSPKANNILRVDVLLHLNKIKKIKINANEY